MPTTRVARFVFFECISVPCVVLTCLCSPIPPPLLSGDGVLPAGPFPYSGPSAPAV